MERYLEALASSEPTPGGGSAATIVGAFAAALVAMVARITARNPAYAASAAAAETIVARADRLRAQLLAARIADEAAYGAVVDAMALLRTTADERANRTVRVQAALAGAAAAPLHAAGLALETLALAREADALGNPHLASDITCAAEFARAALRASAANVRINHAYLRDTGLIHSQEETLAAIEAAAR